jgi:hypothetical protein
VPPVLDLEDDQPQVRPDDDEVRVTTVHRHVVVDEVVLGEVVTQGNEHPALPGA